MNLITLDFETFYGPEYSLSKREWTTESYIRDKQFKCHGCGVKINDGPSRWVTGAKLPDLFARIPWHNVGMIGHNLQFDGSILAWQYGCKPKLYIDTLGMSRAMIGQHSARHGLHYIAPIVAEHNGQSLHKMDGLAQAYGIRELSTYQEKILADYTVEPAHFNPKTGLWEAGDVELTWAIFQRLKKHFPIAEYRVLDWTIRKFVEPVLWLDDDMLILYQEKLKLNKATLLHNAGLETRDLLMSNNKYAEALMAMNVVPPTKINKNGEIKFAFAKTDAEHKALLEHEDPDVQALVAARLGVKSTIEETRTKLYLEAAVRGPWPVAYSYSGAYNTHRFSGNRGGGGNPMNLKRGGVLRDAIMAPEGQVQLVFDLSQIECRLTLWFGMLARASKGMERESLDLMAAGGDLYSYFAGMMYGREIIKSESPNERQVGKSAVLGLGFGMGPARFMDYCLTMGAKGVDSTLSEATVHLYRNTYAGVRAMWRTLEAGFKHALREIKRNKEDPSYVMEPFWQFGPVRIAQDPLFGHVGFACDNGLMVKYPDLEWDAEGQATYRDGNKRVNIFGGKFMENMVQWVARIVLTDKMMEIQKAGYNCVMSTYDEGVSLVDNDEESIAIAIEIQSEIMHRDHPMFPGLPIGTEYGFHKRYGKAKN